MQPQGRSWQAAAAAAADGPQESASGTAQAAWQASDEESVVDGDDEMTEEQALEMEAALECVSLSPAMEAVCCCKLFGGGPCSAHDRNGTIDAL